MNGRHIAALSAEVAGWTAGSLAIWLISLSSLSAEEFAVGTPSALLCGIAATGVRRAIRLRWRVTRSPALAALRLPWSILAETAQVLVVFWCPHAARSRFRTVSLAARGRGPRAVALRGLATMLVSASPGNVVVDADPESGALTVHTLDLRGTNVAERLKRR